ncbi:MAG: hypothetical protein K6T81_12485 [Alicyclobacillus macrosporangiidus]|uniref:hypothetical protein n=1 Tax=Alicyclobacillus macrosporangiidus TaxID=392015 RepID=UPI0026F14F25|nr:hypothetical protein [Alicyclobacillus macrosporangiidus]MCL6599541.1 hypothetical protein [Alicyclobacillus macrosporangiidus]
MTAEELQAIRELWNSTTPGNWEAVGMGSEGYNIYTDFGKPAPEQPFPGGRIAEVRGGRNWAELRANAEALGRAKRDVLRLLDEVERLRDVVRAVRAEAMAAYESEEEDIRAAGGALLFQLQQRGVWIKAGHANDDLIFEDEVPVEGGEIA